MDLVRVEPRWWPTGVMHGLAPVQVDDSGSVTPHSRVFLSMMTMHFCLACCSCLCCPTPLQFQNHRIRHLHSNTTEKHVSMGTTIITSAPFQHHMFPLLSHNHGSSRQHQPENHTNTLPQPLLLPQANFQPHMHNR
jgi:hypothetical protein